MGSQGCCLSKLSEEKERLVKQKEEEGQAGTSCQPTQKYSGRLWPEPVWGSFQRFHRRDSQARRVIGGGTRWGQLVAPTSQPSRLPRGGLGLRFLQPPLICCLGKVGRASCLAEVV